MAIQQLNDEQIRTWTVEQKDRWWLEKVFRGDMPQLTIRAALVGFVLGGFLSTTNLYVSAKTGITLGVGLTSVILAFAAFRILSRLGIARDFTILENNAMQSIATAAGYMVMPLVSSLTAYMWMTNKTIPWHQVLLWNLVLSVMGVLWAFPMKRRFINDEQQPFPEGRACGVVLDTLYESSKAEVGMLQARALAVAGLIAASLTFLMGEAYMRYLQVKLLGRKTHLFLHEQLDHWYYWLAEKYHWATPKIGGVDIRELGLRPALDLAMIGAGGLMGVKTSTSLLVGAIVNFAILAPWMIHRGDIIGKIGADGVTHYSRIGILNQWSIWWGVTVMVVGSIIGLFAKPKVMLGAFKNLFGKRTKGVDVLGHIELPLWISFVGIPILAAVSAWMASEFFGVKWYFALLSLPLTFVLSLICTNAMGLTSWTPTGALSKITQFTFGALDWKNPATNLMTACITSEVASNSANLISDIKPGYMLGAKPRQQALGHIIGIVAGSLASTPLFYLLFLRDSGAAEGVATSVEQLMVSEKFSFPSAVQWKGVADIITEVFRGDGSLMKSSALWSVVLGGVVAAVFEILRIVTRGRFPLSPTGIGLGVVLPPSASLAMWVGAMLFWAMGRRHKTPGTPGHTLWVESSESICAGLIAGAALIGIGDKLVEVFLLS